MKTIMFILIILFIIILWEFLNITFLVKKEKGRHVDLLEILVSYLDGKVKTRRYCIATNKNVIIKISLKKNILLIDNIPYENNVIGFELLSKKRYWTPKPLE